MRGLHFMCMGGDSEIQMSNASEDMLNAPTLCHPRSDKRGLKKANISFSNLSNFIFGLFKESLMSIIPSASMRQGKR